MQRLLNSLDDWQIGFKKPLSMSGDSFKIITETLMCNSTNYPRLTRSQYVKDFGLSATPVSY